jgi:hypothetical protein
MFGHKKKQREKLLADTQPAPQPALALMTTDDHELLTSIAREIQGCLATYSGEPLLDDAEAVNVATIPVPVVEIEYPGYVVELTISVYRHDPEDDVTGVYPDPDPED